MKKEKPENTIPDLTEFTDEDGKKWIQTSTEDLFSTKEINDILDTIDKERNDDEIILAQINFKKVNKEYYNAATELQARLEKQTLLLKKVISESKSIIDKKNSKLKELIEYIKNLHIYISYINSGKVKSEDIKLPTLTPSTTEESVIKKPKVESVYDEVEEVFLPNEGFSEEPI